MNYKDVIVEQMGKNPISFEVSEVNDSNDWLILEKDGKIIARFRVEDLRRWHFPAENTKLT